MHNSFRLFLGRNFGVLLGLPEMATLGSSLRLCRSNQAQTLLTQKKPEVTLVKAYLNAV